MMLWSVPLSMCLFRRGGLLLVMSKTRRQGASSGEVWAWSVK